MSRRAPRQLGLEPGDQLQADAIRRTDWLTQADPRFLEGEPLRPTVRAAYDAAFDELVVVDPTPGGFDVRLPTISTPDIGRTVGVVNRTTNTNGVRLLARPGQTIQGALSVSLAGAYGFMRLMAVSTTLWVVANTQGVASADTTRPYLAYVSTSQVTLGPWPGGGAIRLTCQDGKQRTLAAAATWDITVAGEGGRDTGSEAASTWYYLYAVPKAANDDELVPISSTTAPTVGGPSGYTNYLYCGAVRNDGSSDLKNFRHCASGLFFYTVFQEPTNLAAAALGTSFIVRTTYNVDDVVPLTASAMRYEMGVQHGSGGGWAVGCFLWVTGGGGTPSVGTQPTGTAIDFSSWFASGQDNVTQEAQGEIPLPVTAGAARTVDYGSGLTDPDQTAPPAIAYQYVVCNGWIDGILAGAVH